MNRWFCAWQIVLSLLMIFSAVAVSAGTITYTYDDGGRLTKAAYGSKEITYTHDNAGNLLSRDISDVQLQTRTLAVTRAGAGTGTVTSSPDGIDCGADCTEDYASDLKVALMATAGADSAFVGWSDTAGCPGLGECGVVMDGDRNMTARFEGKGDLDGSGTLDLADAILDLQISSGMKPTEAFWPATVDGDGKIGLEEAIFVLQKLAELR